jgi:hypothetical protein
MAIPDIGDNYHFERVVAVLNKMPGHCTVVVWCNNRKIGDALHSFLREAGVDENDIAESQASQVLPTTKRCVMLLPDEDLMNYSHWTRDPFVFRKLENGQVEILKSSVARLDNTSWADNHLGRLQFETSPKQLRVGTGQIPVAGGNILFDQDFILVGARELRRFIENQEQPHSAVIQALLRTFNGGETGPFTCVIEIGKHTENEPNLLRHIDLYLSLTGRFNETTGKYSVLLGRCEALFNANEDELNKLEGLNRYLDGVATDLKSQNFDVLRNRIPLVKLNNKTHLCFYNNCLTEVIQASKSVWMPRASYGQNAPPFHEKLLEIEHETAAIWAELGFKADFIEADFHSIMDDVGALHCITNELYREPETKKPPIRACSEFPEQALKHKTK